MKTIFHPAVAWVWAIGALLATLIWHFPQYGLIAGMAEDMIHAATGWKAEGGAQTLLLLVVGLVVLAICTWITWNYGSGHKGVRFYERLIKGMVIMMVVAFALVVFLRAREGAVEWGKVFKGFLPLSIPTDKKGVFVVMAAFGAVIGINSTFLFPYTLLARGWGKKHRGLSGFDLVTGMFFPFCIITSLIVIAAGCTIYDPTVADPSKMSPMEAARILETTGMNVFFSHIVFGFGVIGMALTSATIHMLMCGFAACELLGVEPGGWKYKLACLFPVPGFLGVILWKYMSMWIGVPTSAACGLMLPIAYILFLALHNNKAYLGADKPTGGKAVAWNVGMVLATLVSIASAGYFLYYQFVK